MRWPTLGIALAAGAACIACRREADTGEVVTATAGPSRRMAPGPAPIAPPIRPTHPLSQSEARRYGLALVNRDRAAAGLAPVDLDEVASSAAARHVRDMVAGGFTAHWGTDGSVPELRYTEAGGDDLTTENAGCFADARARPPSDVGPFEPAEIERFQAAFMNERPPSDGHRRNILTPSHNRVGLSYSKAEGERTVCVVQEFVDQYGSYAPLPRSAKAGDTLRVEGTLAPSVTFGGIGLARVALPTPRAPTDLLQTSGYQMPSPFISYFRSGFVTPKPVTVNGREFSLALPLTGLPGPGLYEVQVFAAFAGMGNKLTPVSLRTVRVP